MLTRRSLLGALGGSYSAAFRPLTSLSLAAPALLSAGQGASAEAKPSRPLTIFAAASLKTALDALIEPLKAATAHQARYVYAASSALARQIEQGAPADLLWSADREWMEWCLARNLIQRETVTDLLGNELVMIAPLDAPVTALNFTEADIITALAQGRLATSETRSVPAGRYAKEALQTLGLWNFLATRLAETDHVRAALLLVARGEAPLGIVYASDAKAEPRVKIVTTFPATSHKPIIYPLALTRDALIKESHLALTFFQSAPAQKIFKQNGFSIVTPHRPT